MLTIAINLAGFSNILESQTKKLKLGSDATAQTKFEVDFANGYTTNLYATNNNNTKGAAKVK